MNKKEIQQFLQDFIQSGRVEINNLYNALSLDEALELNKKKDDIYFVAEVENDKKRNSDKDIKNKNYFVVDIDIREEEKKKTGKIISNEEIFKRAEEIKNKLNENKELSDWKYIVYSGNGIHIYYVGDFIKFDKDVYQRGVRKILKKIEEVIGIKPDYACSNIARIIRLPGTINWKMKQKYKMKPEKCFILFKQNKKSNLIEKINIIGKEKEEKQEKKQVNKINAYKKNEEYIKKDLTNTEIDLYEEINRIPLNDIIASEFGLQQVEKDGKIYFYEENDRQYKGFRYNIDNNTLYHGGSNTWYWGQEGKTYNTFTYIKEREKLSNKETFERFINNYSYIKDLAEKQKIVYINKRKKETEESFKHIDYGTAIDRGVNELLNTNPDKIIKWGWELWDNYLGGIYTGKIYLIGAETGTGKSTFVNIVADNIEKMGHKVVKYSLEDRLEDKMKEELFFCINRLRKADGKEPYKWTKFVNNEYSREDEEYYFYIDKAVDNLKQKSIVLLDRKKPIGIKELAVLIEEEAKKGVKFFIIDHLHYFKFYYKERQDLEIQNVMHILNDLVRKHNLALFLIAHYKGGTSREKDPYPDMFKDGAAIKQVANIIIQLKQVDEGYGLYTKFYFTKLRGPIPKKIICGKFDYKTFNYVDFWEEGERDL